MKRIINIKTAIFAVAATIATAGGGFAAMASASSPAASPNSVHNYRVNLSQLNGSGAHGTAYLKFVGNKLDITINATGMTPGMVHPQHIHGLTRGTPAMCPGLAQDTNNDGLISVTEGAPKYGPIKLNLTKPTTPFGPNDTVLNSVKLFTDFAGVPSTSSFPVANASGNVSYSTTITFAQNNTAAQGAKNSLTPLGEQEIVLHGAYAPVGTETTAGGSATSGTAYDALLPVACAGIRVVQHHDGSYGLAPSKTPVTSHTQTMGMHEMNMDSGHEDVVQNDDATAVAPADTTMTSTSPTMHMQGMEMGSVHKHN